MDSFVLSIDQGTTGTTALVFDRAARVRGRGYSEFTQHYTQPGWVEHDALEIWRVSLRAASDALAASGIEARCLRAVGITNQRETVVAWERSTGLPVARAIVWQDRRTAAACDELKARGLEETIREKTGLVLDPYFSGTKIKWLLDNTEHLRARAARGEVVFGTIDSWLVWKLTGGRAHTTDPSNASRTLLFDIRKLRWDAELLALFGVPRESLPEVKPSSTLFGETEPSVFFGARVPVAGVAGDQQAALFGQACYDGGMVKNTYGTGSFLLMNTGPTPHFSSHGLLTTIAWQLDNPPAAPQVVTAQPKHLNTRKPEHPNTQQPHFPGRARRVVQIFCAGGVSHVDTFDYKPELVRSDGKAMIGKGKLDTFFGQPGNLMKSPFAFRQRGRSGLWVSDLLPHLATCADQMTFIYSMVAKTSNHTPATFQMNSGQASTKPNARQYSRPCPPGVTGNKLSANVLPNPESKAPLWPTQGSTK